MERSGNAMAVVVLLLVLNALAIEATVLHFVNLCNGTMKLSDGKTYEKIARTSSLTHDLKSGAIKAYRYDTGNQATLAEFSITETRAWYDISIIPAGSLGGPGSCSSLEECKAVTGGTGFNVAMQIVPTSHTDSSNCRTLTCLADGCEDAYQYPDQNSKTHSCSATVEFQVIFCPTSSDSSVEWIIDDEDDSSMSGSNASTSSSSASDAPAAVTKTPEPTVTTPATSSKEMEVGNSHTSSSASDTAPIYVVSALGGSVVVIVAVYYTFRHRRRIAERMQALHWPDRRSSDAISFVLAKDAI